MTTRRILFLDDAPWRHSLVRARLEGPDDKLAGIEVIHVWTVDECINAMQNHGPFDQIFLDRDLNDFVGETGKESSLAGMYGYQELTGRDVTRWMAKNAQFFDNDPEVIIHSWNSVDGPNMVVDLQEAGFRVRRELFNGGKMPSEDDDGQDE